jgi:NifU-like protein involved in Fe-S cluster formation
LPDAVELSDLYSDKILELAGNAAQPGRLDQPDARVRKVSRVCGSAIEVDVEVRDGIVAAYGHEVSACALGQASAAVVAREIVGTSVGEVRALRQAVSDMLKAGGRPPAGRWADMGYLEPARDFPNRHGSTLLVFDAVVAALDEIEAR